MSKGENDFLISETDAGILGLIGTQLQNFPSMKHFLVKNSFNSGSLILPQSITTIDGELNHNSELACECYSFLDVVNMLVYNKGINPEDYYDGLIKSLGYLREPYEYELYTVGKSTVENLIFSSKEDLFTLLKSNMVILSLYIYSVVSTIFYK